MATTAPSLSDIAFQISGLTYNISKFLEQTNAPSPSFNAGAPTCFPTSAPAEIQAARQQLLELTLNLHNLILGPEDRIRTQTAEFVAPAALRWITHFKIADHVPQDGSISYTSLASAASVPESQLKRIVRYTMLNGYFTEPSPNQVAHSAMSLLLATSPQILDYVSHSIGFSYPVSTKMVEATERYGETDKKTETAFNVAHETDLPMFAWLKGEPEHSARFGRLMGAMRAAPIYSVSHLVNGYDWTAMGSGKVVDVGGSLGHTSLAIAEKYSNLTFVVQDLPEVVEQGKAKLPDSTSGSTNLSFMPHDFFTPQPIKDADIYLLRQILHDWPDAEATTILKHLVASMKPGAKILIMDQVVPPPGMLPNAQEKAGRVIDLVVMSHFNGKQRDLEDWKRIFAGVNGRLVLNKVVVQSGSVLSIIELGLEQESVVNGQEVNGEKVVVNGVNGEHADEVPKINGHEVPKTNGVAHEPQVEGPTGESQHSTGGATAEPSETSSACEKAAPIEAPPTEPISETDPPAQDDLSAGAEGAQSHAIADVASGHISAAVPATPSAA